jgi:phosphoadenosine phosphosulfate reductase
MDAPETVYYIRSIPNVHIDYAYYEDGTPKTIWNLIPRKKLPPTRIMRWCCSELKEWGGKGRLRVTGIRWDESTNRKNNSDVVKIIGKEKTTQRLLQENGLNFILTNQGGW